jgi:hypothetical protein
MSWVSNFFKRMRLVKRSYTITQAAVIAFMTLCNFGLASLHPSTTIFLVAGGASLFEWGVFLPLLLLMEIRKIERDHKDFEKEKQEFLADPERKLRKYTAMAVSAVMQVIWVWPQFIPGSKNQLIDRIISELSKEKDRN